MDYKLVLAVLLIGHFFGDFYFQSENMAKKKDETTSFMALHGFLYLLAFLPALFFFTVSWESFYLILSIPVSHYIFDVIKGHRIKKKGFSKKHHEGYIFFIDQAIHIAAIISVVCIYATRCSVASFDAFKCLVDWYKNLEIGWSGQEIVRFICLFAFLGKPANIFVQNLFKVIDKNGDTKPQKIEETDAITGTVGDKQVALVIQKSEKTDTQTNTNEQRTGRVIGLLERFLIAILVITGQYVAIGFVIAAKSLTRFDKISNDPDFAEKYLIGTMSSMIFAIAGALLCMFIPYSALVL